MDAFDVTDRDSWYFGSMTRQEATEVLMNERERGVFLIRDSNSIIGDYVLCVREDSKVSNYIINKVQQQDQIVYRIGDQSFECLSKLLTFYTLHYLDTTPLKRPASKRIERVVAKYDFAGSDHDDLPFKRGDILTILRKDEEQWWTARNHSGQIGQIPVPYVEKLENIALEHSEDQQTCNTAASLMNIEKNQNPFTESGASIVSQLSNSLKKSDLNRKLPAYARVKQARVPNAYDKTALKLEIGDTIKVTKTNINGQWEGELKGKRGHFPFTHVEFLDDCENVNNPSMPPSS